MNKLRRQLTNCSIKSIPTEEIDFYSVVEVKNHILKLDKENEDAFDEKDIAKYVNDSKYLRKFLIKTKGNCVEESIQFASNILHWRKEIGLTKLSLNSFPKESFLYDYFYIVDNELTGGMCAVVRGQYFIKAAEMREMSNMFICFMIYHLFEKLVQKGEEFKLTVIFDSRNVSLNQYDMEFISFLIDLLTNKMPNIINYIVLYDVPWYCMPLLKTVLLFLPDHWKKVIVHANSKTIKKYVAKESLPFCFPTSTRTLPIEKLTTLDDKKSLIDFTSEELALIGMKKENITKYLNLFKYWDSLENKIRKK